MLKASCAGSLTGIVRPARYMQKRLAPLVLTFFLTCGGCRTAVVRSEADLFLQRHPELHARYVRMSPTNATTLKEQAQRRRTTWERAREFVQKHVSEQTDLDKEVEWNKGFGEAVYQDTINVVQALESAQTRFGGQIYFYEFNGPDKAYDGYLLLSGGEIRKNIPTGTIPAGEK